MFEQALITTMLFEGFSVNIQGTFTSLILILFSVRKILYVFPSGSLDGPFHNLDRARPMSEVHSEFASAVGCGDKSSRLECLREVPVGKLLEHMNMFDKCNMLDGCEEPILFLGHIMKFEISS